jgi:hypothetical protein
VSRELFELARMASKPDQKAHCMADYRSIAVRIPEAEIIGAPYFASTSVML